MKIAQCCWYSDHIGKILIMMRITIISIQLLDELAILWVIVASYWLWFPQVSSPLSQFFLTLEDVAQFWFCDFQRLPSGLTRASPTCSQRWFAGRATTAGTSTSAGKQSKSPQFSQLCFKQIQSKEQTNLAETLNSVATFTGTCTGVRKMIVQSGFVEVLGAASPMTLRWSPFHLFQTLTLFVRTLKPCSLTSFRGK